MKAKHLRRAVICSSCGKHPFVKLTPEGVWYWCLACDAHMTDCKHKEQGVSASTKCGCIA